MNRIAPWIIGYIKPISSHISVPIILTVMIMKPPPQDNLSINSLPEDALVEILARVGSCSVADLINARNSCKDLLNASDDTLVFRHLSMHEIQFVPWRDRDREFHERCCDSGNAEALYRQGMVDFFGGKKAESGLVHLKRAAEKGHAEATYVYGMILFMCSPDRQGKSKGKEILSVLVGGGGRVSRIREFRRNVGKNLRELWVKNIAFDDAEDDDFRDCEFSRRVVSGWERDEDGDGRIGYCGPCSLECEARLFLCMIRRKFLVSSVVLNQVD